MRIGNPEAKAKALALAESFLASRNQKGWDWKCIEANPDPLSPRCNNRKTHAKWSVIVEYSKNGSVLDGPGVILVDLQSGECRFA
ncbi:MAG: hypothetical protein Q4G70_13370 [Pseudomonadota bacterium]|nr:hypothetical protein [Pseudomonadota bacterium]